jgi:hypothetical protein
MTILAPCQGCRQIRAIDRSQRNSIDPKSGPKKGLPPGADLGSDPIKVQKGALNSFLRPRLSARYRFSKGTLAGTLGNGRDAPKTAVRLSWIERVKPTQSGRSCGSHGFVRCWPEAAVAVGNRVPQGAGFPS